MTKIRVLNLYSGIGGNRKLWPDDKIDVTAVEIDPKIAAIYQKFFPNDKVIIADAHQFLLDHFKEFDFIWSSPPCPSHSILNTLQQGQKHYNFKLNYPDMRLYQEIILLQSWFKGFFCIENVISYYKPLIEPQLSGNHYFWTNFKITTKEKVVRGITSKSKEEKAKERGFDIGKITNVDVEKVLNNCVMPELGLHIFNMAFKDKQKSIKDMLI